MDNDFPERFKQDNHALLSKHDVFPFTTQAGIATASQNLFVTT